MKSTALTNAAMVIFASVFAMLGSVAMSFVQAFFIPFVIEGTDVGARPPEQRTYTLEELNRAEAEAKARIKARMEDKSFEARARDLRSMQRPALWVSWIPWVLLPIVLSPMGWAYLCFGLLIPGLLVMSTLAPPESLAVFGIALLIGAGFKHAYARARTT